MSIVPAIGMTAIILVILFFKRKAEADKRELESLDPEKMRPKIEALAIEKIAQRKKDEPGIQDQSKKEPDTGEQTSRKPDDSDDSFIEGESLL